jgi:hypothetical protein
MYSLRRLATIAGYPFPAEPDRETHAGTAHAQLHAGDKQVGLYRRPVIQEYFTTVHLVPVGDFLLAHLGWKLWVLAQLRQPSTLDAQRYAGRIVDRLRVNVQPDLVRLRSAMRAGKVIGFDGRFDDGLRSFDRVDG